MDALERHIAERAAALAAHPFTHFVADRGVPPRERLAFAPAIAPWVMSFADLSKFVLPGPDVDPLQRYLNAHAREEEDHWRLYVADLEALAVATPGSFSGAIGYLWQDGLWPVRQAARGLIELAASAPTATARLVLLEAIEATSAIGFASARQAARDFTAETGVTLRYFGEEHQALEDQHSLATDDRAVLDGLRLPAAQQSAAWQLVDRLFGLVGGMFDALHAARAA